MSISELFLIVLVSLVVFSPSKLPMLAEHLGKLFRLLNDMKQKITIIWLAQLQQQQLNENRKRAEKADAFYQKQDISDSTKNPLP